MYRLLSFAAVMAVAGLSAASAQTPSGRPHNVVLFVADGLRSRMVDDTTAPTMAALARDGVSLRNSHSLFPTFTTANASAMATGHMLGDTGDFSNTIYAGFEVANARNSSTPFLESDPVLADVDEHFAGNYLDEATILKLARDKGYSTASVGKVGPALIFDHTERTGAHTILVDDATGSDKGIPLSPEMSDRLKAAGLPLVTPRARRQPKFRYDEHARHADGEYCTTRLFRGRDDPGDPAALQGARQTFRAGLLVARSGWNAALSGRQPQRAYSRHQRPDVARCDPQCRRQSRPPSRGAQRARASRFHRHHRRGRPRLLHHFEGEPNQLDRENEVFRHARRPLAARLRGARSRSGAGPAAARSRRWLCACCAGSAQQVRQRPDRRRQDQSQNRRGGQWRLRLDLSAGRRPRSRQADRRHAAHRGLRERHFCRCQAWEIPRHALA